MNEVSKANLVEYYFKFKELAFLHRKFGFGKDGPRSSEKFTESICMSLFGFKKDSGNGVKWDLIDPKTNARIEVKATSSLNGTTDLHATHRFDYLFWGLIQFDTDLFTVHIKKYSAFEKFHSNCQKKLAKALTEGKTLRERLPVTLSKYTDIQVLSFKFDLSSQRILALSDEKLITLKRNSL